jgi:PAS domain S-box-containing protein
MDSRALIMVFAPDGRIGSLSPGLRDLLGLSAGAPTPPCLSSILDPDSVEEMDHRLRGGAALSGQEVDVVFIGRDGLRHAMTAELFPGDGGTVVALSPARTDWIGEYALSLIERTPDMVISIRFSPDLGIRYANDSAACLLGCDPDRVRRNPDLLLGAIHPADRATLEGMRDDAGRVPNLLVLRFRRHDGEWRWMEISTAPVFDGEGRLTTLDGIARDVTIRRRIADQYRRLAERSPELIYRIRLLPDFGIDYASAACEAVTGFSREELYRDPELVVRALHAEDRSVLSDVLAHPERYANLPLRFRLVLSEGRSRWLELVNIPVYDESDRVVAIEGVGRNITERHAFEDALKTANRKLNLLSSVTRHDILNQLTVLMGSLELAEAARDSSDLGWFLGRAQEATGVIRRLVEFTRDYQEVGEGRPGWVRASVLIRRAADPLMNNSLAIEVPESEIEILADPLIEKVFFTLIENALRHGNGVTMVRFAIEPGADGSVLIVCQDDGVGVPDREKSRIFERGYGRNTGFGLYLSREILAITEMAIRENGVPGRGARFEITIPPGAYRRFSGKIDSIVGSV